MEGRSKKSLTKAILCLSFLDETFHFSDTLGLQTLQKSWRTIKGVSYVVIHTYLKCRFCCLQSADNHVTL